MRKDEFPIVDKLVKDSINEVLDKIRAEIKAMSGDIETIADVLQIIDKYKAEGSGEWK